MEWSVTDTDPRLRRRYRVAFVATAMLLVGIAVTLPFSLASVLDEILGLTTGKVLPLLRPERAALAPVHSRLHLAVTEVDEVHLVATFRLSGHRTCGARCPWRDRLLFVSAQPGDGDRRGTASLGDHHASRNHRDHDRDLPAPAQRRADPVSVRRVPSDRGRGPAACSPGRPRREPGRRPDHAPSRAHAPGAASSPADVGPRWGGHRNPPGGRRSCRVRRRIRPRLRAAPLPPGPRRSARAVDRRRRGLLGVSAAARGSRGQLRRARPRHLGRPRASSCRSISIFRRQSISRFPSSFSSCSEVSR